MLSPTTLTFSVLALVLAERPLRTGVWFFLGAFGATLAIGVAAAFVIGDAAASGSSTPKTWVAILDIALGLILLGWVSRAVRRPRNPEKTAAMVGQMTKVASSSAIAIVAAGATLANPGGFIPIALKSISEEDPSATQYIVDWLFFAIASVLPLLIALVMLLVAREWAERILGAARDWLVLHARTIAAVIIVALAAALLRNGIAGLTS